MNWFLRKIIISTLCFRDASLGASTYNLTVLDCLHGIYKVHDDQSMSHKLKTHVTWFDANSKIHYEMTCNSKNFSYVIHDLPGQQLNIKWFFAAQPWYPYNIIWRFSAFRATPWLSRAFIFLHYLILALTLWNFWECKLLYFI